MSLHCSVADSQDNPDFAEILSAGLRYIHDSRLKGEGVLVHCGAGESRAPALVIAYIMLHGASFDEAYRFVKSLRLLVNIKFENILRNYDFEKLRFEIFGS